MEILRLRDHSLGLKSHAEVLADRVVELETQNNHLNEALANVSQTAQRTIDELNEVNDELNEVNQALQVELNHSPMIRIARAVARRLNLR